jgi:nucleotide-binding universal stress UspA family protein
MWEVNSILCPTDFSESSEETLRVACQLARDRKARLITLHVAPKSVVSHVQRVSQLSPEQAREKLWQAMRLPRAEEADIQVEHRLEEGDPVEGILRVALETHCGLIVIGRHAKSGWARWLTGGAAESLVQGAPCSVLVVKEPLAGGQAES